VNKQKIAGIATGVVLLGGIIGCNTGLSRTPGVILGGTDTPAPSDLSTLGERGRLLMKLAGFPPMVNYLTYAGTPEGVITATRPDGGYWARRVREGTGDGWLRIGDATYSMRATEVVGDARLPLLALYGGEPLRDWEVFVWTAR